MFFSSSFICRSSKVLLLLFVFAFVMTAAAADTAVQHADTAAILQESAEKLDEFRFWEIRRELHRIHHHLEYVPYMSFSVIGIFIIMLIQLILQIKNRKKP